MTSRRQWDKGHDRGDADSEMIRILEVMESRPENVTTAFSLPTYYLNGQLDKTYQSPIRNFRFFL
jgi:hypothetical protein